MAEVPDYPSNNKLPRKDPIVPAITSVPAEDEPKLEKVEGVTEVKLKKPSLGKRFRESFAGDDAHTVGQYVLIEVVVPAVKSLISDGITMAIERALYGDTGRSRSTGGNGRRQFTDYASRSSVRVGKPDPRDSSPMRGESATYQDLVFNSRAEAELVIDKMREQMQDYGAVTIANLYDLAGVTQMSRFTDVQFGWVDMRGVSPSGTPRSGYIINLPRPVRIDG